MRLGGCLAHLAPWTPRQVAILRSRYGKVDTHTVARLTKHTVKAVLCKAHRLGVSKGRLWTDADDKTLTMLWDDISIRGLATKFSRSTYAVYQRAKKLGLSLGAPSGWEFLSAAKVRTGFHLGTLRMIIAWAVANGVIDQRDQAIRDAMQVPKPKDYWRKGPRFRRQIVDALLLDEAIAAWMDSETLEAASRRFGVCGDTVRRTLRDFGVELPKASGRSRPHLRLPSKTIDAAMKARAAREAAHAEEPMRLAA